jgi:hypothetical protein
MVQFTTKQLGPQHINTRSVYRKSMQPTGRLRTEKQSRPRIMCLWWRQPSSWFFECHSPLRARRRAVPPDSSQQAVDAEGRLRPGRSLSLSEVTLSSIPHSIHGCCYHCNKTMRQALLRALCWQETFNGYFMCLEYGGPVFLGNAGNVAQDYMESLSRKP